MKNELKARFGRSILQLGMLFTLTFWALPAGAANKNVWIDSPVITIEGDANYTTCIGLTDSFVAHQSGYPPGSTWYWSGATRISGAIASPSLAERTWTTSGGPYPVRASYNNESSYAAKATVVNVASVVPDQGDLVQGSSPLLYVTCVGLGDILATATPTPALGETSLPWCWYFAGGQPVGFGLLQRKLSKSYPGNYFFEAGAGSTTKRINFKLFQLLYLVPSEGCELDDFDGDAKTKSFAVHTGSGDVTVTAGCDPQPTAESELPSCWTLSGGNGTSRSMRTIPKGTAAESVISCSAGSDYQRLKLFAYYFNGMVYKWNSDPGYLPVEGCGRLLPYSDFSYKAQVVPDSTPLQWEYWDLEGTDELVASGMGREFSQRSPVGSGITTSVLVRFFIDCNPNLQYDAGEPELSHTFNVKMDSTYYATANRHVETPYTWSQFLSSISDARLVARRRDRFIAGDGSGDVHCRLWLLPVSHPDGTTVKTFGVMGDQLDEPSGLFPDKTGTLFDLFPIPGTYKMVNKITVTDTRYGITWDCAGYADPPTQSIVIRPDAAGFTFLHEFMHLRGASHITNANYIMHPNALDSGPKDAMTLEQAQQTE